MKSIELSNLRIDFQVDDEDYDRIVKFKWAGSFNVSGKIKSICRTAWDSKKQQSCTVNLAQEILQLRVLIDHKDRNALNNQKCNLRICTEKQNLANRGGGRGISGYIGVYPNRFKWRARIKYSGKERNKNFITVVDAAKQYDEWAKEAYGEFAVLNFPENQTEVSSPR